jgi:hypothetical protein
VRILPSYIRAHTITLSSRFRSDARGPRLYPPALSAPDLRSAPASLPAKEKLTGFRQIRFCKARAGGSSHSSPGREASLGAIGQGGSPARLPAESSDRRGERMRITSNAPELWDGWRAASRQSGPYRTIQLSKSIAVCIQRSAFSQHSRQHSALSFQPDIYSWMNRMVFLFCNSITRSELDCITPGTILTELGSTELWKFRDYPACSGPAPGSNREIMGYAGLLPVKLRDETGYSGI